ncbi:hypothetical protein Tco_0650168 [Tanacetum coccineum]
MSNMPSNKFIYLEEINERKVCSPGALCLNSFCSYLALSVQIDAIILKDLLVIIDNFPKSDMLELKIFCNRWMRHSDPTKSFLGLLFCPLEVVNEAHDQCMEEKKDEWVEASIDQLHVTAHMRRLLSSYNEGIGRKLSLDASGSNTRVSDTRMNKAPSNKSQIQEANQDLGQ